MSENAVEIASLVRQIVLDTLKASAPGIANQMREAIANSVTIKLRAQLVSTPTITSGRGNYDCTECGDGKRECTCGGPLAPSFITKFRRKEDCIMNETPTVGPAMPERQPGPMPEWQQRQLTRLTKMLSEWSSDDHEDAITLCRSDVICLLDAVMQRK